MYKSVRIYFRRGLTTVRVGDVIYDCKRDYVEYVYTDEENKVVPSSYNELCNAFLDDEDLRKVYSLIDKVKFVPFKI